jgi:hypothetical protein
MGFFKVFWQGRFAPVKAFLPLAERLIGMKAVIIAYNGIRMPRIYLSFTLFNQLNPPDVLNL